MAQLAISGIVTMDRRVLMAVSENVHGHVAAKQVAEQVGRHAAGRRGQQHQPHGKHRRQAQRHHQRPARQRQRHHLQRQRHDHGLGVLQQALEIRHAERQAQAKHHQREGDEQQGGEQLDEVHDVLSPLFCLMQRVAGAAKAGAGRLRRFTGTVTALR
jgi:hypothetical protein